MLTIRSLLSMACGENRSMGILVMRVSLRFYRLDGKTGRVGESLCAAVNLVSTETSGLTTYVAPRADFARILAVVCPVRNAFPCLLHVC